MKHIREIAVLVVLVIAGVAFSQQVQEGSKKPAAARKSECCSKMKTKGAGKTACCASDSTSAKDEKSAGEKH